MLLERDYLPDAIVTINDITAIGVINHLYSEGVQVPHDISIMGFDDISICEMVTPPLSTIHQRRLTRESWRQNICWIKLKGRLQNLCV